MTREELEKAIKCCNPYDENCGDCPFHDLPQGRCFEVLAKAAFNMLLEDREKLQKQVKEYQDKIEQGTLIELPCKVGDSFYSYECFKYMCYGVEIGNDGIYLRTIYDMKFLYGKDCFLTREEAKKN